MSCFVHFVLEMALLKEACSRIDNRNNRPKSEIHVSNAVITNPTLTRKQWAAIIAGLLLVGFIWDAADGSIMDPEGAARTATAQTICEEKWWDNKSTAESPYMTRERYIANCLETARDLEDGRLDGN
jgi:hypothetical protein